jgi:hypothetical protein
MTAAGPLQLRTHVAACPHPAKADPPSHPDRQPAPTEGLANRSSYNERGRVRQEREFKESREATAREVAERNRRVLIWAMPEQRSAP